MARGILCSLLTMALGFVAPVALGQDDDSAEATGIVLRAARRLEAAQSFRVRMQVSYDVVQDSGLEVEFGNERLVSARRPDRFRVDVQDRERGPAELYFDGEKATLWKPRHRVFSSAAVGSGINQALDALENDFGVPTPLSALLRNNVSEVFEALIVDALMVGPSTLDRVECDHVLLQTAEVDAQLWVTRGDAPLIRRIVITYIDEPGRPQFRADLLDWELDPKLQDELFRFEAPDGAERVKFVRAGSQGERTSR